MIKDIPIIPYMFGTWLYFNIPNIVTAVIVKPPYVAYVKPTGIVIIAFARKKIQRTIVTIHIVVGTRFVNPLVVFKKPFEVIPNITANKRYIYPKIFVIAYL